MKRLWPHIWIILSAATLAIGMNAPPPHAEKFLLCAVVAALWAIEARLKIDK